MARRSPTVKELLENFKPGTLTDRGKVVKVWTEPDTYNTRGPQGLAVFVETEDGKKWRPAELGKANR